jgi:hypothetical protein
MQLFVRGTMGSPFWPRGLMRLKLCVNDTGDGGRGGSHRPVVVRPRQVEFSPCAHSRSRNPRFYFVHARIAGTKPRFLTKMMRQKSGIQCSGTLTLPLSSGKAPNCTATDVEQCDHIMTAPKCDSERTRALSSHLSSSSLLAGSFSL